MIPAFLYSAPLIAFKAIPSGDVATNAFSVKGLSANAKGVQRHRHGAPTNCITCGGTEASSIETSSNASDPSSSGLHAVAFSIGGGAVATASDNARGSAVTSGQYR